MIEERLADFALGPMDGPPRDVFRLSLLDWAACGIAGRGEPVARVVRSICEWQGRCTTVLGGKLLPREAALLNGTISHALDYDDTHFAHVGHPSVVVIPAALALAESRGEAASAFRDAALIGMEASIRVGVWLGRTHYEAGFHQTATAGAFGAALACARLMNLSRDRTIYALGAASTMASGLKSQFGTMGKPLNAGIAASAGIEAALLAEAGLVSDPKGLSGPQGFGPSHHGEGNTLHEDGWLMEGVSHKLHACCHGLHATLEALRGHRGRGDVLIRTNPRWLKVCDIAEPRTGLEAKFSYRLTAAMALEGWDTAALETFTDDACRNPALVSRRDRVRVEGDDGLSDTQTLVTVGNETLTYDLAAPIPMEEWRSRVRAKAAALVGDDRAGHLWKATASDRLSDLTDLFPDAVS